MIPANAVSKRRIHIWRRTIKKESTHMPILPGRVAGTFRLTRSMFNHLPTVAVGNWVKVTLRRFPRSGFSAMH